MNFSSYVTSLVFSLCTLTPFATHPTVVYHTKQLDQATSSIKIDFDFGANDFVYQDYIKLSVDSPHITISEWQPSSPSSTYFDPSFKETKKIFKKPFSIECTAHCDQNISANAHIHLSYLQQSNKKIDEKVFPLNFDAQTASLADFQNQPQSTNQPAPISRVQQSNAQTNSWTKYLSSLLEQADTTWMRLLLAFILGLLLSLTPCIYPMIPITMGILQSQASKSLTRNFILALSYTAGLASTFAILGLAAAFTGSMFGSFMSSPFVVLSIVVVLVYLAGSMIGLYDMYIPSFMNSSNNGVKGGSVLSAFAFGAISGTVASPCLSPGLVLLLTIVTTLGNKLLGFSLLFCFGIGLSMPLLLIGMFSSSLSVLPQAGMWMIEVKRLFGFMMIGMCFYFLQNLLPQFALYSAGSLTLTAIGLFYLNHGRKMINGGQLPKLFGSALIVAAILLGGTSIKAYFITTPENQTFLWEHDYEHARIVAQEEHKMILLDISAPYCSICKAIDAKHFANKDVQRVLKQFVPVKIDEIDPSHKIHAAIQKNYHIMGAPTFVVIDPETENQLARWESNLYEMSSEKFIEQLTLLIEENSHDAIQQAPQNLSTHAYTSANRAN